MNTWHQNASKKELSAGRWENILISDFGLVRQALTALNTKKALNHVNDENAVPIPFGKKQESKVPVDQFKAFTVFEEKPTDENVPPPDHEQSVVELDCSAIDTLYTGIR